MPTQLNILPTEMVVPAPRTRLERTTSRQLTLRHPSGWYLPLKATLEFVAAMVLSIIAIPIVALCALAVKLTSPGPAFYTQVRVGRGGKLFTIYKLRSMINNCESLTGPRWCIPGDPRVTPVGWFLRVSHLDELPQLLNVLRGEMALVGPRPERPEFVPDLEEALPTYRMRLRVRPGVTGLAQILLPPDTDLDSVRRKLSHDLYYLENMSFWFDLRLLAGTAFYAARLTPRWLGLPRSSTIEQNMRDLVGEPLSPRMRMSA